VFQHLQNRDERIQDEGLGEVEEALTKTGIEDSPKEGGVRKRKGIRARVARRWLRRLGFNWREVRKGIYIDGHERPDVVEYRKNFLDYLHGLGTYLVEFNENGEIKEKNTP
jgi:ribosomal protein S18 acetylase RimI-like enzyme